MTKHGEARELIAFRLDTAGVAFVDVLAAERDLNRSETIRLMLAFAQSEMPRDWTD